MGKGLLYIAELQWHLKFLEVPDCLKRFHLETVLRERPQVILTFEYRWEWTELEGIWRAKGMKKTKDERDGNKCDSSQGNKTAGKVER